MLKKQNVNDMSAEQLAAYVEAVREKRRQQSKKYYDNQIKGDTYIHLYVSIHMYIHTFV